MSRQGAKAQSSENKTEKIFCHEIKFPSELGVFAPLREKYPNPL